MLLRKNVAGSALIALQPRLLTSMGIEFDYNIEWAINCVERLRLARSTNNIITASLREVKMSTLQSVHD